MADPQKGDIAFHLIMALCADLAVHDDERLGRMLETLGRMLEQSSSWHYDDQAVLRAAYDAILQLPSSTAPSR